MKSKANILFVNFSLDVGGIETLVLELSKKLDPDRFQPAVCSLSQAGNLGDEFAKAGIPVYFLRKKEGLDWRIPFKLRRIIKDNDINILHTQNQSSWLYAAIAAKLARIPLVHTMHSNVNFNNPHPRRWMALQRWLAKCTSVIAAVSRSNAEFMINRQRIPARKIKVIYNGVAPDIYNRPFDAALKKKELSIEEEDVIIGNVARFSPPKDHETLVRAFKIVADKIPAAKLILVGDGPLETEIKTLANNLDLNSKVKFLGRRRDIPELLKIFDIFVLSSSSEGLPVAILEAMASELPVIATNVAGNPEAVINGETGLIVPAKNPEALAEAICRLLQNPKEAKRLGDSGKNRIKEYFTFDKMVKGYEDIYNSILNKQ